MEEYQQFYDQYCNTCDIYIVYIWEAHFVEKNEHGEIVDGWPIGSQYNYPQHKTLVDRMESAHRLCQEFDLSIPVLVDSFTETSVQIQYNAWPDSALLIFNEKIKYISRLNMDGSRNMTWTAEMQPLLNDLLLSLRQ